MSRLRQLTLRGLNPRVQRQIREFARRERVSLRRAAIRLLEKGASVERRADGDRIGHSLDHLIGTWSAAEANSFLASIRSCEHWQQDRPQDERRGWQESDPG